MADCCRAAILRCAELAEAHAAKWRAAAGTPTGIFGAVPTQEDLVLCHQLEAQAQALADEIRASL
jgi:hypothetical protein